MNYFIIILKYNSARLKNTLNFWFNRKYDYISADILTPVFSSIVCFNSKDLRFYAENDIVYH